MLEHYRNAVASHRILATVVFLVICAGLVLVHQQRKHTTFVSYAFELGDTKSLSPQSIATQIRALIDARAVFAPQTGQRDQQRPEVRILTPRSGRIIVLSSEDGDSQRNREALEIIVAQTRQLLEDADRQALADLNVNIDKAQSEQLQFTNEVSTLTLLRQDALEKITRLEREADQIERQSRTAPRDVKLAASLKASDLRQQALAQRISYLTRIEERLTSAKIATSVATARLRAAEAELDRYRPSRKLFGPHVEPGSGFGPASWAILVVSAAFLSFVLLPLLLSGRGSRSTA